MILYNQKRIKWELNLITKTRIEQFRGDDFSSSDNVGIKNLTKRG